MRPILKWLGNKENILNEINDLVPKKQKYFEPFVGGGSVFLNLCEKNTYQYIWISDINQNLITTYQIIRDKPNNLISELEKLKNNYNNKNFRTQKGIYQRTRKSFNESKDDLEIASKLIFLNKTCFGGLYRTNKSGEFNTAFLRVLEVHFDYENILNISKKIKNIKIECCDYKNILNYVDNKSFVFLDPPYYNTFNNYDINSFNGKNLEELYEFCTQIDEIGASFILCNSEEEKVKKIFKDFSSKTIEMKKSIKGEKRRKDILIFNR